MKIRILPRTTQLLWSVSSEMFSMMKQNYKQQGEGAEKDSYKIVVNVSYAVVEVNSFNFCVSEAASSALLMSQ